MRTFSYMDKHYDRHNQGICAVCGCTTARWKSICDSCRNDELMKNSKKETQVSNELNPCPFCGAKPYISQGETKYYLKHKDECYFYGKHNHGVQLVAFANDSDVIASWNTRPIEDALQARIDELEKQVEWHLFDIDNVNTYPPCADMYLTLSIPERTEYREIDDEETYDVLWFELYSEEYWHKHNVTHWAYLPAPPQEEE